MARAVSGARRRCGFARSPNRVLVGRTSRRTGGRDRAVGETVGDLVEIQPDFAERGRYSRRTMPRTAGILLRLQRCVRIRIDAGRGVIAVPERAVELPVRRVARCRKSGLWNHDPLDGRCARPALFDRTEPARSAQRKTRFALRRSSRDLSRQHLRYLARPEVRDLNLSSDHVDPRAAGIYRDAKLRALYDCGEVGGLDLEMLDVALFHLRS